MKSSRVMFVMFSAFIFMAVAINSFFVVNQTQQALVLRFGKPVNIINAPGSGDHPGLKFKMPFVDTVEMYDKRILVFNAEPMTVILEDQDRLIVDAFVTYRIKNPLQFYQAVRTEQIMNMRLESILEKSLRDTLGGENLSTLLSDKRSDVMKEIRDRVYRLAAGEEEIVNGEKVPPAPEARKTLETGAVSLPEPEEADLAAVAGASTDEAAARGGYGIEVVDVRIMRTDLPKETSAPIYERMRSDRQKVAERFRAEGQKESQIIRSEANKQRTIMLAEADKKSETLRGEGDGEAARIFAEAFGSDEEFFAFYRTMQAYRKSLGKSDTTLILSPGNDFLKYLEKNR